MVQVEVAISVVFLLRIVGVACGQVLVVLRSAIGVDVRHLRDMVKVSSGDGGLMIDVAQRDRIEMSA